MKRMPMLMLNFGPTATDLWSTTVSNSTIVIPLIQAFSKVLLERYMYIDVSSTESLSLCLYNAQAPLHTIFIGGKYPEFFQNIMRWLRAKISYIF